MEGEAAQLLDQSTGDEEGDSVDIRLGESDIFEEDEGKADPKGGAYNKDTVVGEAPVVPMPIGAVQVEKKDVGPDPKGGSVLESWPGQTQILRQKGCVSCGWQTKVMDEATMT